MLEAAVPAKINLALYVTGRRADGYHLLSSIVCFAECGETITVSPAPNLELIVTGPYAPQCGNPQTNLVSKAAELLHRHYNIKEGAAIALHKAMPVGAGLGGGSADAAVAAQLLCKLWRIELNLGELARLLLPLGADIPACLQRAPLIMQGIGEDITPLPIRLFQGYYIILANPNQPAATADVYRALTPPFSPVPDWSGLTHDPIGLLQTAQNDLTTAAITLCPAIEETLNLLRETQPRFARMSGSGATCFALFDSEPEAEQALAYMKKAQANWWLRLCPL